MNNTRRQLVLGTAAFLALPRPTLADARLTVPAVDTLTVRVITDSSYDTPIAPKSNVVKVKRAPFISRADYRKVLHSEWGLALALESRMGTQTRHMLLDSGYTVETLLNNMEIIGIDGTMMQAIIISHGHFDHLGGLIGYLEKYRDKLPADLTLYAGGEDNFCIRKIATNTPGHFADWGTIDRRDLERLKVKIAFCEKPTVIMGHAFSTGPIPRRTFEKVSPGGPVQYWKTDGRGCDLPELASKAGNKPTFDEHVHEHATCFNVKDRGLVVMSSCGHTGLVNAVLQAQAVSGVKKVHAVLGGFHLFPVADDYLRRVIGELKALDPDVVVPLHCSGPNFVQAMREMLNDRLITSTTGTELTFGS